MSACDLCDDNGRCGHTALTLTGISHDKFDGCLTAALGTRHSQTSPSRNGSVSEHPCKSSSRSCLDYRRRRLPRAAQGLVCWRARRSRS